MRTFLCTMALLAAVVPAFGADKFAGSWNMNSQKSSGPQADKEGKLLAVDDGGMQTVTVTGKAPDGTPFKTEFSVPMKGGEGKVITAGPYNGVRAKAFTAKTSDFMFTTDGKPAMHIHSVLSADGKVMTTTRTVMTGPNKPGKYTDVWERE